MQKIDHNIFVETGNLGSNNSMILTESGIVLIDSPHKPTDAVTWRREIESRGESIYLINTDHHIDHTMGNTFLGGTVVSHFETREKLLHNAPSAAFLDQLIGILDPAGVELLSSYETNVPTITFSDRMTLYVGGVTFQLIHRKGHTPNSAMIYLPDQKILFSGDLVCEAGLPSLQEACVFAWLETLSEILDMDVRYVIPGHGNVCTLREVSTFREQIEELVGRVRGGMAAGRSRAALVEDIRFADQIHTGTDEYPGYPDDMIEEFQRRSIGAVFDQITEAKTENK